jgi:RNA polymerase sporulation-specific sigma factor
MGELHHLPEGKGFHELADPDVDVHQAVVVSIEAARVRQLVRRLPMLERKVIAWRFGLAGEQLSFRQVAERLGVSKANAIAIEQRALDRLRGCYGAEEDAA